MTAFLKKRIEIGLFKKNSYMLNTMFHELGGKVMTEKNILSYFHRPDDAQRAEKEILALGAEITRVDSTSKYPGEGIDRLMNPVNSDFVSLANLTLGSDTSERNQGILMSADVAASGMSAEGSGFKTEPNYLLTAVVNESIHKEALKIVEKYGGIV